MNTEKSIRVKERLELGAQNLRSIVGDSVFETTEFSSQAKYLFSLLETCKVEANTGTLPRRGSAAYVGRDLITLLASGIRDGSALCTNGLLTSGGLYPFTVEYREHCHRQILHTVIVQSEDREAILQQLGLLHQGWRENYIQLALPRKREEWKLFCKEKVDRRRIELYEPFLGNTRTHIRLSVMRGLYPTLTTKQLKGVIARMETVPAEEKNAIARNSNPMHSVLQRQEHEALVKESIRQEVSQEVSEKYTIDFDYTATVARITRDFETIFHKWILEEGKMSKATLEKYLSFDNSSAELSEALHAALEAKYSTELEPYRRKQTVVALEEKEAQLRVDRQQARELRERLAVAFSQIAPSTPETIKQLRHAHYIKMRTFRRARRQRREALYNGRLATIRRFIRDYHSANVTLDKILYNTRIALKVRAGITYALNTPADYVYRIHSRAFSGKAKRSPESIRESALVFFKKHLPSTWESAYDLYESFYDNCAQYYGELFVPYKEARIQWGLPSCTQQDQLAQYKSHINAQLERNLEIESRKSAEAELEKISKDLLREFAAIGDTKGIEYIILPTGILVWGIQGFRAFGFSPLDPRMRTLLSVEQWECWQQTWAAFYHEHIPLFDKAVRELVVKDISEALSEDTNLEAHEQALQILQKEYKFELPEVAARATGLLTVPIAAEDVQSLEQMLPKFGKFLRRISTGKQSLTLEPYIKSLQSFFLSGKDWTFPLLDGVAGRITLNCRVLTDVMRTCTKEEATSLLALGIAIKYHKGMDSKEILRFKSLVADRATVSKMTLYRLSGQKVESAEVRKAYMLRALFASEFAKYVTGDSAAGYTEFFEALVARRQEL